MSLILENNQNVGYSIPRQSGLYPPPPIHYKNARALALAFVSQLSAYDISHHVLKDAIKDMGRFYAEYDFILSNGRVLE